MKFLDLPRGLPNTPETYGNAPRALWRDPASLFDSDHWQYKDGKVFLGAIGAVPIGIDDDRHLLTIAGSRAGKA